MCSEKTQTYLGPSSQDQISSQAYPVAIRRLTRG